MSAQGSGLTALGGSRRSEKSVNTDLGRGVRPQNPAGAGHSRSIALRARNHTSTSNASGPLPCGTRRTVP